MEPERFKVDLRGVVDLLSTAIYSSPRVYLRELIQNAADAITARSLLDPSWRTTGMVITPAGVAGAGLRIRDDGIGLTAHEVAEALATVGGSLKRDALGLPASGMLGRFGIGLLSALMVSDEIVLRTRSARGGPAVEWIGRSDGTYVLRELTDDLPVGTQITLITRADDANLVGARAVRELATRYGAYLPVPIHIADVQGLTTITQDPAFLSADPATLIDIGTEILGVRPFDAIPIDIPLTGTRGVAFVLPHPVPPQSVGSHTVYCRRMLVTDRSREIAPEWAFFTRIIVDSTAVNPTASREALIEDEALTSTREAIGMALRGWIAQLAAEDPLRLEAFVATHYLGLKALAVHDDDIAPLIVRLLPMETSRGTTSVAELVAASSEILYVPTTDQFRQVNALSSGRQVVVNATYTWDAEVLRRLRRSLRASPCEKSRSPMSSTAWNRSGPVIGRRPWPLRRGLIAFWPSGIVGRPCGSPRAATCRCTCSPTHTSSDGPSGNAPRRRALLGGPGCCRPWKRWPTIERQRPVAPSCSIGPTRWFAAWPISRTPCCWAATSGCSTCRPRSRPDVRCRPSRATH